MANTLILTLPTKPENAGDMIAALKGALPDTRNYDGCQSVSVMTPEDEPGKIMLLEVWDSKAHQEKYFGWRVETGLLDAIGPMLAGDPIMTWVDDHDV